MLIEIYQFTTLVIGLTLLLTCIQSVYSHLDIEEDKRFEIEYEVVIVDDASVESYDLIGESIIDDECFTQ